MLLLLLLLRTITHVIFCQAEITQQLSGAEAREGEMKKLLDMEREKRIHS